MAETVDALEIEIRSRANEAATKVEALATSISSFGKNVAQYVGDLKVFADVMGKIAAAAKEVSGVKGLGNVLRQTGKNAANNVAREARAATSVARTGSGSSAEKQVRAEAERIRKETDAAWRAHERLEREAERAYRSDHKLNWKAVDNNVRLHNMRNTPADNTAREIAEWKREEQSAYEEHMGRVAQGIVGSRTLGGGLGAQQMINVMTGVSREAKSAAESAELFNKAIAEGIVGSRTVGAAQGVQAYVDGMNGVSREAKSAAESAEIFNKALAEGTVANMSVGPDKSLYDLIWNKTGLDRGGFGSARESAKVFEIEAERAEQKIAEIGQAAKDIVADSMIGPSKGLQAFINDLTGVSRAAMNAEEYVRKLAELEKLFENTGIAKQFNPKTGGFEPVGSVPRSEPSDAEYRRVAEARWVAEHTPDRVAEERKMYESIGKLDKYESFWGPETVRAAGIYQEMGLIDEATAQAIKDAAMGVKETTQNTNELGGAAKVTAEEFANATNQVDLLRMKLDATGQKLEEALGEEKQDPGKIARLTGEYQKLQDAIRSVGQEAQDAGQSGVTIRGVLQSVGGTIKHSIVGQLMRVAKMRALRGIVKGMAEGFKEGLGNLYDWSSKVHGEFASAMNTAASKTMLLKNSLATALAPAIQALVPVLSTVVGWVRTAANAVAQFFAMLTGNDSWTMALETSEKWGEDAKKSVGGAGKAAKDADKAAKDLLADWDELNVIQSQTNDSDGSGSGGGGGSGKKKTDTSKMFQEMTVFDEWTKDFELIRDTVAIIGAGIAGWFAVERTQSFLDAIGIAGDKVDKIFSKIKKGVTGAVLLAVGFKFSEEAGKEYAEGGFTWGAFTKNVIGLASSAIGGSMIASAFGINPAIGVALGIGVSLVATIVGYNTAKIENAKDYIRKLIKKNNVIPFDVEARVEKIHATIADADEARKSVGAKVDEVLESVRSVKETIKIGLDANEAWKTLYSEVLDEDNGLIAKIRKSLGEDKNVVTMYYRFVQKGSDGKTTGADGNNNYQSSEGFKIDNQAISYLEGWYQQQGAAFAKCFVDGETGEIRKGQEDVALAIAETIAAAEQAAAQASAVADADIALTDNIKGVDKDIVMSKWGEVFDEYEQAIADGNKEATEAYYKTESAILAQLEKTGADPALIAKVRQNVEDAWNKLLNFDFKAEASIELQPKKAKVVTDFIKSQYGELSVELGSLSGDMFRNAIESTSEPLGEESIETFKQQLYGMLNEALGLDFDDELLSSLGIKFEDLLDMDSTLSIRDLFLSKFDSDTAKKVFEALGFSKEKIAEIFKETTDAGVDAAKEEIDDATSTDAGTTTSGPKFTKAQREAAEALWDAWKEKQNGGGYDALDSASEALEEAFDGNEALLAQLDGMINELISEKSGDGTWNQQEDLPAWWFSGSEEQVTVDAQASGMAMDSTLMNLGGTINLSGANIEKGLQTLNGIMQNVEEYTRLTANRDFTVVVAPSAAMGGVIDRSRKKTMAVQG